jgi:serine/threonine-protein kinase
MDPGPFAERRVGTTIRDKWTLEKLLGVGGMAAVYVGVHRIGQRSAIKILHPEIARSPELCARFEQEARAVNRFTHPGVVAIRDVDVTEDGAPFLVMELLEGASLADLAARPGGVETGELIRLVDALLDVLVAAHARDIVHRDIKPDNLFVTADGRLKVLDFGIARVKDGIEALHTRAGAMLGTAPYMAPEQILGRDVDARVDVFATGATMFRLLSGRLIHEARAEPELIVKMATVPAPPLASVAPHVPREVGLVVDRALAFDRAARYPDAASMQRDVRALLGPASLAASTGTVGARTPEGLAAPSVEPPRPPANMGDTPMPPEPATDPTAVASPQAMLAAMGAPHAAPVAVPAWSVAVDPTVAVGPRAATLAPEVEKQRREETKTAAIFLLAVSLLLVLTVVMFLLSRPSTARVDPVPAGSAPSSTPSIEERERPPEDDEGRAMPPDPRASPWPHKGKGKGKGRGRHREREDD